MGNIASWFRGPPPPPDHTELIRQGDAALADGDVDAAAPLYEAAVEACPTYYVGLHRAALVLFLAAQWRRSAALCDRVLRLSPSAHEAKELKARCLEQLGEDDVAAMVRSGIPKAQRRAAAKANDVSLPSRAARAPVGVGPGGDSAAPRHSRSPRSRRDHPDEEAEAEEAGAFDDKYAGYRDTAESRAARVRSREDYVHGRRGQYVRDPAAVKRAVAAGDRKAQLRRLGGD